MDPLPALPPQLVELGRWVASYYLAPVGDTFRAMLPPQVELRVKREWRITESGRARLCELKSASDPSETEIADLALLQLCKSETTPVSGTVIGKLAGGVQSSARLLRRGELATQEVASHRAPRMQKIVAWQPGAQVDGASRGAVAEARVERVLAEERGPLPLRKLLAAGACHSRGGRAPKKAG